MPEVYVTNFNKNFTGVSATAAGVARAQSADLDLVLVGQPLPDLPAPISTAEAFDLSRTPPPGRPFSIWHVRRNSEMRAALWARDVLRRPIRIVFTSAAQRRHSAFPRWLISRMDAVIATTDAAAAFVPKVRAVVHHGVDTERFHPAPDRSAAWRETGYPGRIGIATVGRIRPEKGTDLFVETMLRVLPEAPDATALVIGKASREHRAFEADLKTRVSRGRFVATHPVSGRGLARRDPRPVSRHQPDRQPAPLRRLWHGAARSDGVGHAIRCHRNGPLSCVLGAGNHWNGSPLEDTAAAAAAVMRYLSEPDTHAEAAARARTLAIDAYSTKSEASGINAVYEMLWAAG